MVFIDGTSTEGRNPGSRQPHIHHRLWSPSSFAQVQRQEIPALRSRKSTTGVWRPTSWYKYRDPHWYKYRDLNRRPRRPESRLATRVTEICGCWPVQTLRVRSGSGEPAKIQTGLVLEIYVFMQIFVGVLYLSVYLLTAARYASCVHRRCRGEQVIPSRAEGV